MSACINRAPEGTFGAAVAEIGVHDLLKVRTFLTVSANRLNHRVVPQIYDGFVIFNLIYGFELELTKLHNLTLLQAKLGQVTTEIQITHTISTTYIQYRLFITYLPIRFSPQRCF